MKPYAVPLCVCGHDYDWHAGDKDCICGQCAYFRTGELHNHDAIGWYPHCPGCGTDAATLEAGA